jgi:hypothetical protein
MAGRVSPAMTRAVGAAAIGQTLRAAGIIPAARSADWYACRVASGTRHAAAREINKIPAARRPTNESRLRAAGINTRIGGSRRFRRRVPASPVGRAARMAIWRFARSISGPCHPCAAAAEIWAEMLAGLFLGTNIPGCRFRKSHCRYNRAPIRRSREAKVACSVLTRIDRLGPPDTPVQACRCRRASHGLDRHRGR